MRDDLIGKDPRFLAVKHQAELIAPSELSVFIRGERGTGKGALAKFIHAKSNVPKKDRFISVNCGALSKDLIESELFGHKQGAFTGADTDRNGHLERADGGTLFLDEVAELTQSAQVKLLRAIEEKAFLPVGANSEVKVNFRVIVATNESLRELAEKGRFRRDLYDRLVQEVVDLPALRDRRTDIPLLAEEFCRRISPTLRTSVAGVWDATPDFDWPGNVRELQNVVERVHVYSRARGAITQKEVEKQINRQKADIQVGAKSHQPIAQHERPVATSPEKQITEAVEQILAKSSPDDRLRMITGGRLNHEGPISKAVVRGIIRWCQSEAKIQNRSSIEVASKQLDLPLKGKKKRTPDQMPALNRALFEGLRNG